MDKTKALYDMDAYAKEFDAVVIACNKKEEKEQIIYEVILDQTLFFPEQGGQTPDQGTIAGIPVVDVQIQDGIILHTIKTPLVTGSNVHGIIDWTHRFHNMQQHSGEHIFSGLVHKIYGYDNVGFHLSDQIVTMDFNGVLTEQQVEEIEQKANEVIVSNVPILITYPTKEELEKLSYRSKIDIEGQVRIVTIPGTDVCACCAPHVKNTGEIGFLKIMTLQNYKGGVRLSILCGFRALYEYRKKDSLLTEISGMLSTSQESAPGLVQKLKDSNQALKYEVIELKNRLLNQSIQTIPKEQPDVVLFEEGIDALVMRSAVNELTKLHSGVCGVFTGTDTSGYQFIIGSSTKDVRTVMTGLKDHLMARGGGSAAMVQGSVSAKQEEIKAYLLNNE